MNTLDATPKLSPTFLKRKLKYDLGDNALLPNALCELPIFSSNEYRGANTKNRPTYTLPTLLSSRGESSVYQTAGEQLNQATADVFCELVRRALKNPSLPTQRIVIQFKADEFLREIDRTRGTANRKWLGEELSRLKRAVFKFELKGLRDWETSLVSDLIEDRSKGDAKSSVRYTLELDPRLVRLFNVGWKILSGKVLKGLQEKNDQLAKAVYALYENQPTPHDINPETLKVRLGRGALIDVNGKVVKAAQQDSKWLIDLTASLKIVKELTNWPVCEIDKTSGKVKVAPHKKTKKQEQEATVDDGI